MQTSRWRYAGRVREDECWMLAEQSANQNDTPGRVGVSLMNVSGGLGLLIWQAERHLNFVYNQTGTREPRPIKASQ